MINLSFKKISDLEESLAMNLLNIQNLQYIIIIII